MAVMNHVRRKNTIIPAQRAQFLLEHHYGINQEDSTPAGTWYNKNGYYHSGDRAEQTVIFFLPDDIENGNICQFSTRMARIEYFITKYGGSRL